LNENESGKSHSHANLDLLEELDGFVELGMMSNEAPKLARPFLEQKDDGGSAFASSLKAALTVAVQGPRPALRASL